MLFMVLHPELMHVDAIHREFFTFPMVILRAVDRRMGTCVDLPLLMIPAATGSS